MRNHSNYSFRCILFTLILTFFSSVTQGSEQCASDLKPQKLVVVGVWKRSFDNSTAQYRISDEDLSVRGYERANTDKATSTVMLARHPESCIVHECGVRLSAMMQVNGAILHTDHRSIRMNDSTMDNIEDEFYCAEKSGFCGADVPIYRLVQHSLNGPHYSYSFDNVGQSLPGYEKEFFPLCYAWRQTPSVVLFNSSDNGVCLKIPDVENGKIEYSNNQLNVFSIGTSATLRCDSGFVGNGTNNLLCTKDGWYPRLEMMGNCVSQDSPKKPLRLVVASDVVNPEATCPISTTPNGNIVYSANVAASTSKTSVPSATRATVLCNLGFVPTTSVTSSKCVDGEWIPALPQCLSLLDLKCPILSAPRNGELVFTNSPKPPYSLDSTISLKCDRNFFGMGNLTAKCTSSGWDQKIGRCEPLATGTPCSAIASPANGNLLYVQSSLSENYASGTSAYLMCSLGTSLSGSVSTLCTNGQWTPAIGQCTSAPTLGQTTGNCAAIPNPVNGTVTYTSGLGTYTSGTIATLTCSFMSTVSGSATSTCLSGIWNPAMGTCVASGTGGVGTGTTCPNPVVINGNITYSQGNPLDTTRPALTTAMLNCNNGYTVTGNTIATCISGTFTPSLGTCTLGTSGGTGTTCSTPFIMNGIITFSQGNTWDLTRPSGTTGTLNCNSGYSVTGNSQATCTNGVFTPTLGTCNLGSGTGGVGTGTTCPNPVVINGNITYSQGNPLDLTRPSGTTGTLNCNSGYSVTGNSQATCTNGVFTPTLGTCNLGSGTGGVGTGTTCPNPVVINGNITYSQGNPFDLTRPSGTTGTLNCNSGYSVTGNSQATCTNGVFTPTLGTCNLGSGTGGVGTGTTCPNPVVINGNITYSQGNPLDTTRPALTTAMLYCNNGFTLTGNAISTCISGTFTPSLGTCTLGTSGGTGTTCSTPFIMNGIVTFSQGNVYDLTRPSGTTGTLTCNTGYSITGNSQATCTNGVFTPTLGTCNLGSGTGGVGTMQCTGMIAPIGGNVTYSNGGQIGPFPSGTTVTGTCTNGGAVQGASSAQCSNGMWSPMFLGTCSLIGGSTTGQCSAPTLPAGAQATYVPFSLSTTSYTSGTVATVTCTSGGSSLGSTTCTNGLWSPAITGLCSGTGTGTTCPALTRPVGETVTYDGQASFATTFNTGVIARVTCTNGTQIGQASCLGGQWTPAITATCSGSSTAIGTQCIGVIAPANSQVRYSDGDMVLHASGATVTLTCLNSATVTGNTISTCTNGAWTPTLGTCSSSGTSTGPCYTPPLTPTGATLTYSSGFFAPWTAGSSATMSCPAGQTAQGTTVTYCTNAAWAPALGTCSGSGTGVGQEVIGAACLAGIAPVLGATMTYSNGQALGPYPSATLATATCQAGYVPNGIMTSSCTNGIWTPASLGICELTGNELGGTTCGRLGDPLSGTLVYSALGLGPYPSGTSATVLCNIGTTLSGSPSALCTNGVWNPLPGTCVAAILKRPPAKGVPKGVETEQSITPANDVPKEAKNETSVVREDLVLSGEKCPPPIAPAFGEITYSGFSSKGTFDDGTTAALKCNLGYKPTGPSFSTCRKGSFRPIIGKCSNGSENGLPGVCVPLSPPKNARIVYIQSGSSLDFEDGTTGLLYCEEGYAVTGIATLQCQNGQWEPQSGFGMCDTI